jgi:hypothetical protein
MVSLISVTSIEAHLHGSFFSNFIMPLVSSTITPLLDIKARLAVFAQSTAYAVIFQQKVSCLSQVFYQCVKRLRQQNLEFQSEMSPTMVIVDM